MRQIVSSGIVALCAVLLVSSGPAHADQPTIDISEFSKIEKDPRPKSITRNAHYVISNEGQHHLFEPHLAKAQGGVMMGVGADQMYIYAGWGRPHVLVPMDFDHIIVDVHYVYGAFFKKAKTPAEMIALWAGDKKSRKAARALLREAYKGDDKQIERVLRAYRMAQKLVVFRLKRIVSYAKKFKVGFFITDQGQYDHCRQLWVQGRVFPIRGDLTASKTIKSIAAATKASGLTVRMLYMSNAEQYFNWTKNFRENMLALPFDDKSLVLRTYPDTVRSYLYYSQLGTNFHKWLKIKRFRKTYGMLRHHRTRSSHPKFFTIEKDPPPPKAKRKKKGRK